MNKIALMHTSSPASLPHPSHSFPPSPPPSLPSAAPPSQTAGSVLVRWAHVDLHGHSSVLEMDKAALMQRVGLHARDLRILDPLLSYPSAILGRERAIVVNLEVREDGSGREDGGCGSGSGAICQGPAHMGPPALLPVPHTGDSPVGRERATTVTLEVREKG